ncbi:MAG: hypothetical protein ABSB13_05525 [Candidatus Binatus sp.]|jgi:hypothetical protein
METHRDIPTNTLDNVLLAAAALSSSNLFVVSGAGLAIPVIPPMDVIVRLGISAYHQIGSYPARQAPQTEIRERLLPPRSLFDHAERWKGFLLCGVYDEALAAFFQRHIYRPIEESAPANYRIFNFVPPPAVLFDFNTDALLANYCEPPHIVLNPHGAIERRIIEHPEFEQFLRAAAEFGLALPNSSGLWLPGPELKTITRRNEYKFATERLSRPAEFLLLIGYSFGRQPNGNIDDDESFEFLGELLKRFHRQIVVVDPCPEHVSGLFEDRLRQRICACKLYWNHFAEAGCLAMAETPDAPNLFCLSRRIAQVYDERTR